jgi:hypothetical protein
MTLTGKVSSAITIVERKSLTWFRDIEPAFLSNMGLVGKPLYTLDESIHVRVLKDVNCHDHLVVSAVNGIGACLNVSRIKIVQEVGDSLTSEIQIAVRKMSYSTDMIYPVNKFADLPDIGQRDF